MDLQLLGSGSVVVALVVTIGYLLRQNHVDRKQYQDHIAASEDRQEKAITAMEARYEKRLTEAADDNEELRDAYEGERRRRMDLEEQVARYRRLFGEPPQLEPGRGPT